MKIAFVCFLGCTIPALFGAKAQGGIVYLAGNVDYFAAPADNASPSAALVAGYLAHHGQRVKEFDVFQSNVGAAHTFNELPDNIVSATLTLRLKASPTDPLASNDFISLLFLDGTNDWSDALAWRSQLGPLKQFLGLGPNVWSPSEVKTFQLDLGQLPLFGGKSENILDRLNSNRFLDIVVADDTAVDYMKLTVETGQVIPEPGSLIVWSFLGIACCGTGLYRKQAKLTHKSADDGNSVCHTT